MTDYEQKLEFVKKHIGEFPDFPKKGILFRDLFTALTNGEVCKCLKDVILNHIRNTCPDIDVVVGLDARGFLFSFLIASELGIACVPIRKKGKLPGECISVEYALEYGTAPQLRQINMKSVSGLKHVYIFPFCFGGPENTCEMQVNAIKPNQKVLIIDDLLATGGSLEAAVSLIERTKGNVVHALVVMELEALKGRERVKCDVHSLIKY